MPKDFLDRIKQGMLEANAVNDFVDWLYENGPDPMAMPRRELLAKYWLCKAKPPPEPTRPSNVVPIRKRMDGPWGA